ncbi:hypothetical protein IX317_000578 [Fusobacterium sp. DD29]|uniref:LicD family protein n=1 Tax=unclassified Fusobacterium TaxID=2648384 RepID=UPI001B8ADA27|nr:MULTISPECIES: LicD family protein [unclassified Fusobacterium]MBR8700683.1 hypothetical protein [Fusobacterium sp. DD45]MBR8710774.1 hypothetical protein [Fusobacterium sp. DD28]MBR8748917.1 hypothetical protein [Fusobacterium sp. DD29]MBR8751382.1 hypothetical protein [Fusobacterium sp. DD26]MBR8761181.1 hypothetical protein [Fusobacterium sp. DD25]
MKKVDNLVELQRINLKILEAMYKICNENKIRLYLLGGTLLGAVRHKGFIPWDDDVDVSMTRTDYERLKKIMASKKQNEFILIDPEEDKKFRGYIPIFAYNNSKMISKQYRIQEELKLGISIFIYDGITENRFFQWLYLKKMYFLRSCHALCRANFKYVNTNIAKLVGPILQPFFSLHDVYKYKAKILSYQKKYDYKVAKYVAPNADAGAKKETVLKSVYEDAKEIEFEGIKCLVPSNYLEHLEKYYGNFMELPPEDERIPKHSFSIWVDDEVLKK